MSSSDPLSEGAILQRAVLPVVMFDEDVAVALQVDTALASELIERGFVGATFSVNLRAAVLREDFLSALREFSRRSLDDADLVPAGLSTELFKERERGRAIIKKKDGAP